MLNKIQIPLNNAQENLSFLGSKTVEEVKFGIEKTKSNFIYASMFYDILIRNLKIIYKLDFTFNGAYPANIDTKYYVVINGVNFYIGQINKSFVSVEEHKAEYLSILKELFIFEGNELLNLGNNIYFYNIDSGDSIDLIPEVTDIKEEFNTKINKNVYKLIIDHLIKYIN